MTTLADLETPAVTVHLDVMADNIRRVQAHLDRHGVRNRPHIKTHKIPDIGRMQLAAWEPYSGGTAAVSEAAMHAPFGLALAKETRPPVRRIHWRGVLAA